MMKKMPWLISGLAVLIALAAAYAYFLPMNQDHQPLTYTDTPDVHGFCGTVAVSDSAGAHIASFRICEDSVAEAYDTGSEYVVRTEGGREWHMEKESKTESMKEAASSGSFTRIKE